VAGARERRRVPSRPLAGLIVVLTLALGAPIAAATSAANGAWLHHPAAPSISSGGTAHHHSPKAVHRTPRQTLRPLLVAAALDADRPTPPLVALVRPAASRLARIPTWRGAIALGRGPPRA
jgi:hypothetical protein